VVASIIDPLVREDGVGEPVLFMRTERGLDHQVSSSGAHPVRERLLAKARLAAQAAAAARPQAEGVSESADEDSGAGAAGTQSGSALREDERAADEAAALRFESLPQLADDLDLIGAPERQRSPPARSGPPVTAMSALLSSTLGGVCLIALLFALLIQVAPHTSFAVHPRPPEPAPGVALAAVTEPSSTAPRVKRPARQRAAPPWRLADAASDPQLRSVGARVGNNSLLGAMQAAGISQRDAYRVLRAFEGVKDLNRCRPRDRFSALLDTETGRLSAFEYVVSDEEVYQAREGKDGTLKGQALILEVKRERTEGVIVVQGTLDEAAEKAGFEPGLTDVVNKALAGYSSVGEMKDGDVLAFVVQEVTVLGEFSRYAGIEALEYRPVGGEPVRVYYHATEKARGYVDSRGRVFGKSRWARPVAGASVTSRYNPKRMHPILKVIKPHNGTDFGAATGTPVLAAAQGQVSFVGRAGPNGNMVRLSHSGGYETGYSHLSRFAKGLRVGARVEQKQLVGYVGSTGRSTGPHLHFSAKKNDRFIDPESLNLDAFGRLALSDRQVLSVLRQRYDRLLDALPIPEAHAPELAQSVMLPAAGTPAAAEAAVTESVAAALPGGVEAAVHSNALLASPASTRPAIYMSDQELMRQQPAVHAGEVAP